MSRRANTLAIIFAATAIVFGTTDGLSGEAPNGQWTILNRNGGWCWFQDERAIVDHGRIIFGSVASPSGNVEVTAFDLATGAVTTTILHPELESDDHDVPAITVLPDGRYLAMYTRHDSDHLVRWRISLDARDTTRWEPEQTMDVGVRVTYSNVFRLTGENNRLYNFHRGTSFDPSYIVSEDNGKSWSRGGHLLTNTHDPKSCVRPYVKYASDGVGAIHFVATEAHPQEVAGTSIHHGVFKDGRVYRSNGTLVGNMRDGPVDPTMLTKVYAGDADNEAWTSDIHLDTEGRPFIAYSVHKSDNDHRYRYARWDGNRWHDFEIAYAGRRLYRGQEHYTGNIALDPNNPSVVFISTDADPVTGRPLVSNKDGCRHYELFRGVSFDGGATWRWTPITTNSDEDNIRPIVPGWNKQRTAILWLRGKYRSHTDYDLQVVAMIVRTGQTTPDDKRVHGTQQ